MRNASVHQGENERQWKKREQEHGSFWKFHVVVVQNNGKEMFKKVCCTRKVVILLIGPIVFFSRFRCRRLSALHDFIFCLSKP